MAELSKAEKKALAKTCQAAQSKAHVLAEDDVRKLFVYLEEQLGGSFCDHTLRYTERWLKENLSAEMAEDVIAEITEMGGYCDCEVLFNCYEDYDIG